MGLQDIDAHVKWQGRSASGKDKICGIIFFLVFAVHLIIGFVAWGNANVIIGNIGHCPDSYLPKGRDSAICYHDDLETQVNDCVANMGGGRRLFDERRLQSAGLLQGGLGVFDVMDYAPELPGTIIPVTVVISIGWIGLLTFFSKPIVWATVLLKVACWFTVGAWMLGKKTETSDTTEAAMMCFAIGGITAAVVVWKRDAIHRAAEHLEMACVCVRKNISIFTATGIVQAVYVFYLLMFNLSLINGTMWWSAEPENSCIPQVAPLATKSSQFLSFGFMWTSMFFAGVSVVISSMITATWFWGQEDKPDNMTIESIKVAVLHSLGTVAFGTLVTAITDFLQKQIARCACGKLWWTNPWGCLLHCLSKFLQELIETLTKFTLIIHAINGQEFMDAAGTCYAIMKKHFVDAVVTDQVGKHVLKLGAYVFSVALGFAAWGWADVACSSYAKAINPVKYANYELDTLSAVAWKDMGAEFLFYVFLVFYLILVNRPMFTILFVGLFSNMIHNMMKTSDAFNDIQDPTTPFFTGVFVAAICSILFNFVADITLNVMDTIFLCDAIGKEKGKLAKGLDQEMQQMLSDLPQAKVVSGGQLATGAPQV